MAEPINGVYKRSSPAEIKGEAIEMSTVVPLEQDAGGQGSKSVGSYDMKDSGSDTSSEAKGIAMLIERVEKTISNFTTKHKQRLTITFRGTLLLGYIAYFAYCMNHKFGDEGSILLVVATALMFSIIGYRFYKSRQSGKPADDEGPGCWPKFDLSPRTRLYIRYGLYVVTVVGITAYLSLVVLRKKPDNVQSLLGVLGIPFICIFFSSKPSKINWHPVFWGLAIQVLFATITIQSEGGYQIVGYIGDSIEYILGFSDAGGRFVLGNNYLHMGLAFSAAANVIFFGTLMGLLIHWGVIEFIVSRVGSFLSKAMETGPVESVIAVANIFIGMNQAPLLVRPYLPTMSLSELNALMTCGFASVSGSTLALFIAFGAPANHLLTAAFISAPAALAVAKILVPETETIEEETQQAGLAANAGATSGSSQNALSAASEGALVSVRTIVSSMANMLAFVSLLALLNAILTWLGNCGGVENLTFDGLCGYVLFPLAYIMGTPYEDCNRVGTLIGIKLFATPMVAYSDVVKLISNRETLESYLAVSNGTWEWTGGDILLHATNQTLVHGVISQKAESIAIYAMCGFSAFTAIGISIGGLTALAPERKNDVMKVLPAAFLGGNVASFLTGAVAGLLHSDY